MAAVAAVERAVAVIKEAVVAKEAVAAPAKEVVEVEVEERGKATLADGQAQRAIHRAEADRTTRHRNDVARETLRP